MNILTEIASGIATFVPAFAKALLDGFTGLFITGTGETMTLSPVGGVAVAFIAIGISYKIVNWSMALLKARKEAKSKAVKA